MTTVIIDYGCGNLRSLAAACKHVGMAVAVTSDPAEIKRADAIILPGVGSFHPAMAALSERGLSGPLLLAAEADVRVLGICLGMQLLMDWSDENGGAQGLGVFKGDARKLPDTDAAVPNVGWRSIAPAKSWDGTLLEAIEPGSRFYFSHSYACAPEQPREWLATTQWGRYVDSYCRDEICAAVQRGNVTGLQFHPEKSGEAGLAVLRAWRGIVEAGRIAA